MSKEYISSIVDHDMEKRALIAGSITLGIIVALIILAGTALFCSI